MPAPTSITLLQDATIGGASYSRRTIITDPNVIAAAIAANIAYVVTPSGAGVSPIPAPPVGPCKYGSLMTKLPFDGVRLVVNGGGTCCAMFTLETDFDFVRIIYLNYDTNPHTVNAMAVAVSSSINDGINPTNGQGIADNTLWQPAYANNAGAFVDVPASPPSGTTRALTVPAGVQQSMAAYAPADVLTGAVCSDWVQISSIPRVDGGTLPILMVRSASTNGIDSPVVAGGGVSFDAYALGRNYRSMYTGGDNATTPGTAPAGLPGYSGCYGVQYISRKRGLSVLAAGDSLFQAAGTISGQNDPFQLAAATLSTPSFPISVAKLGFSGMSSLSFQSAGLAMLQAIKPDVMFIKVASPNDINPVGGTAGSGPNAATFRRSLASAFAMADTAVLQQCVPILVTEEPFTYSVAQEMLRTGAVNTPVRQSGWLFSDWDQALTNGGSPVATILPQYSSTALPPHYNDAGTNALAQVVMANLRHIIAARPR